MTNEVKTQMMSAEVEFEFHNTEMTLIKTAALIRKALRDKINLALRSYKAKGTGWVEKVIEQDIVDEYVQVLISYDYSGIKEREEMTELIMRADGKDPNPYGSFKKSDAVTWAKKSTSVEGIKYSIRKDKRPSAWMMGGKMERYLTHSDTLKFDISLKVVNRVLANLEHGRVSWVGDPKRIARMLEVIAAKGITSGRISPAEHKKILEYAKKPNTFKRETDNREYFKTAVEKATEKYKHKWIGLVGKDLAKHIKSTITPTEIEMVITEDNTKVRIDPKLDKLMELGQSLWS